MASLRDHLQDVYEEYGKLTPQVVVEAARDPEHPLHHRFTWDDREAAERHRLNEARRLIRSVRVVYREGDGRNPPRSIRAYHSLPDGEGRAYRPIEEIVEDPLAEKLLLQQAEREWKAMHRRYGHLAEFVAMVKKDVAA